MIGKLRQARTHRYELPLVEPVAMPAQEVPLDPYALGLLLGDGCITTTTTPAFSTRDPELLGHLIVGIGHLGIELVRRAPGDFVLRHIHGGRGGLRIANPVTAALRELGLAGTRSTTKFVPQQYLNNSVEVRLAVLQGLLDTDGGPVRQRGRTCRIQYSTCSERLRDDVVQLVRSLGGVVTVRTRQAQGRKPGLASGRPVPHRSDAHVLDIRLPAGMTPFRLSASRLRTRPTAAVGRCASSTASSRRGGPSVSASPWARRTPCT
jgi:phosphate starvation-inducible PhoH-like protein